MMDKIRDRAVKVKDHVVRNQVAYGLGALSAMLAYGNIRTARGINAFLTEKDIDPDEFWLTTEDYEALKKEEGEA